MGLAEPWHKRKAKPFLEYVTIQDKSLLFRDSKEFIITKLPPNSFSGGTVVKNLPANSGDTRDTGSIPGLGRSFGGGNGNPLQYYCMENSMTVDPGRLQSMVSQRISGLSD